MQFYHVHYRDRNGDAMKSSRMSKQDAERRAAFLKAHSLAEIGTVEIKPEETR